MSSQHAAEIAYLPLKPGTNLSEGSSAEIWTSFLTTISAQPGCNSIHWGREIERPDVLQLVVDWDTYASHKTFIDSPEYGDFTASIGPLISGSVQMFHVLLPSQSPFLTPASAAVTECISLFFEPSHPSADFDANWAKFVELAEKNAAEAQGIAGGWGLEEQKHDKLGKDGEAGPAKFFGGFIGWPSVDAHMRFREHEKFPEVIQYLRDGPKALAVHHVEFQKF